MEESALTLVLEDCLAAMGQGGDPGRIADQYQAERSEILPLLEVAERLRASAGPCPISTDFLSGLARRLQSAESGL